MHEHWIISVSNLSALPSVSKHNPPEYERLQRIRASKFIQDCSLLLSLPTSTTCTACVLMHRFYLKKSFKDYNFYDVGASCLFIATKLEESYRKTKEFISCVAKIASKNRDLELDEKGLGRWMSILIRTEDLILEVLAFDLLIDNPSYYFDQIFYVTNRLCESEGVRDCIEKLTWEWFKDAMKTTVFILYEFKLIAGMCVYLAAMYWKAEEFDQVKGDWLKNICESIYVDVESTGPMIKTGCSEILRLKDDKYCEAVKICETIKESWLQRTQKNLKQEDEAEDVILKQEVGEEFTRKSSSVERGELSSCEDGEISEEGEVQ